MNKVCKALTKDKTKTILFTIGSIIFIIGVIVFSVCIAIKDIDSNISGLGAAKIAFGGIMGSLGVSRNGVKDREKKQEKFNKEIKKDIGEIKTIVYTIQKDNIKMNKKMLELDKKDYCIEKKINKLCKGKK